MSDATAAAGHKVGVVGAGQMGREIAMVFACADCPTRLTDHHKGAMVAARDHIAARLADGARAHLSLTKDLTDFADCSLVIEAVAEDVTVKQRVLADLANIVPADAILATNTSSIPIGTLAEALPTDRRAGFLGMHFSSPASRMAFLEIIPGAETAAETLAEARRVGAAIGKTVTQSADVPGFASNRLLFALLAEAQRLLDEGVASRDDIDRTCRLALGHPLGPFELMDHISTGLTLDIQTMLHDAYGARYEPGPSLRRKVADGEQGRRTGMGFYDYSAAE